MPVLAAVFTLSADPAGQAAALSALSNEPRIMLGPLHRDRLPVVLESDSREADRALWRWAEQQPGVLRAELVSADFSDLSEPASQP